MKNNLLQLPDPNYTPDLSPIDVINEKSSSDSQRAKIRQDVKGWGQFFHINCQYERFDLHIFCVTAIQVLVNEGEK